MKKIFFSFLLLIGFSPLLVAQHELSFKSGVEFPMGKMYWVYKPNASYGLNFSWIREHNRTNLARGFSVSYFTLSPKSDTFYYLLNDTEYGTVKYSRFLSIQLAISYEWQRALGEKTELTYGLNIGYNFVNYKVEDKNPYIESSSSNTEGMGAICPKIGMNYLITQNVGISLQPKFNFLVSLGKTDPRSASYNPNVGTVLIYSSCSLGAFIRF